MSIIVPDGDKQLLKRLQKSGAAVVTEEEAAHQDIRPARIGILNLMPATSMETTETQWLRYISRTVLQIEPVLVKFDDDSREQDNSSRKAVLERYTKLSKVVEKGLDGLIITGDNLELKNKDASTKQELLPFNEITYAKQLADVVDWARDNVRSTIYSCLASHFAINHIYGIERELAKDKIFGVYKHDVVENSNNAFIAGLDDVFTAPHSRWGDVSIDSLQDDSLEILAISSIAGWILASSRNKTGGNDLLIQGHPEYDKYDLDKEYQRDKDGGQIEPINYYSKHKKTPISTWATDARALHSNWIDEIYKYFSE